MHYVVTKYLRLLGSNSEKHLLKIIKCIHSSDSMQIKEVVNVICQLTLTSARSDSGGSVSDIKEHKHAI